MRAALPLVGLLTLASSAHADEWFGTDKALHFGASAVIASGGYALTTAFTERRSIALGVGFGVALGAGIAKEAWDATGRGDPSWKDFTWDVIGSLAGVALAYGVDALIRPAPVGSASARTFDLRPSTFDLHAAGARATFRF